MEIPIEILIVDWTDQIVWRKGSFVKSKNTNLHLGARWPGTVLAKAGALLRWCALDLKSLIGHKTKPHRFGQSADRPVPS